MTDVIPRPRLSNLHRLLFGAPAWLLRPPHRAARTERLSQSQRRELGHDLLCGLGWPGNDTSASPLKAVGVTSCYAGEGVSTVARLLAVAAASCGAHKVLLVDANLGRPRVHESFELPLAPGLAEAVLGADPDQIAVRPSGFRKLWILTAGKGEGPLVYESTKRLKELLAEFRAHFELIVVDLPAAGSESEAKRICGLLDGVLLVVEDGRVRRETGRQTRLDLERAGAHVLGLALNQAKHYIPNWLYRRL